MAVASEAVVEGYGPYGYGYESVHPYQYPIAGSVSKVAYGPVHNAYDSYGYGHHDHHDHHDQHDHDHYVSNFLLRN